MGRKRDAAWMAGFNTAAEHFRDRLQGLDKRLDSIESDLHNIEDKTTRTNNLLETYGRNGAGNFESMVEQLDRIEALLGNPPVKQYRVEHTDSEGPKKVWGLDVAVRDPRDRMLVKHVAVADHYEDEPCAASPEDRTGYCKPATDDIEDHYYHCVCPRCREAEAQKQQASADGEGV